MNNFLLRLESILVFLIYQMQDTTRKIRSKMHGTKLMINWGLKKVWPYAMKKYCLILCYLFSMKNKNTKSFLLLISYSIFLFSSIICVFVFWIWCGDELFFKCKHLAQNWDELKATNRRRIYRPKWESSLKEYPSKTLNIFWKSPYKKN